MKKIYTAPEMDMSIFTEENIVTESGGALRSVQEQLKPGEGGYSETIQAGDINWVP